jgi:hypothetical protein
VTCVPEAQGRSPKGSGTLAALCTWAGHALRSSHLGTTGRDRIRLFACSGTSREAYWGSLLYLAGALFFNVGCVEGLLPAAVQTPRLFWGLYYTPFVAGTACKLELAVLGAPQLATLASWGWHGWLWVCAPHLGGAASPRHAEPSGRPRHGRYAPRPKWRDSAAPSIQAPRASCWAR